MMNFLVDVPARGVKQIACKVENVLLDQAHDACLAVEECRNVPVVRIHALKVAHE